MDVKTRISDAGKLYSAYASRLEKLGIFTLEDFLYHIPFRYDDFSLVVKIGSLQPGEVVTVQGTVEEIKNIYTKGGKKLQRGIIADDTGKIEVAWFNQPFIPKVLHAGDNVALSGRVIDFNHKITLESPEYEVIREGAETLHTGRLVPIYPETKGVSSKWLRRQTYKLLQNEKQNILEYIPSSLLEQYKYPNLYDSLLQVHFPRKLEDVLAARWRLGFNELFLLQLASAKRKQEWEKNLKGHKFSFDKHKKAIETFWNSLPFQLTQAQIKALHQIFADLASEKPMNRLLEGDVGSGKTVVGAIAMYLAHLNGFQSVLMAPTEILAGQHYSTINNLLSPLGVKVSLVTGSKKLEKSKAVKGKETSIVNRKTANVTDTGIVTENLTPYNILIGTHAVLSKNINFDRLGLVVIDEQQRFGVEQRAIIKAKGKNPHLLTMTATPIPRTIALTIYGDLDLSVLDELPKGRKLIKTWLVPEEKRVNGYTWIKKQIHETDSQVFIICPFIEESENMQTVKAATKEFERLQKEVFPDLRLGMLHGRMKGKEKDAILDEFRNKKFDILVATPVVEVGIDIPNATIIVIEASERFGLSQLHQLRGRVGRGDKQSYCLLFTESTNPQTIQRLKAMETSNIGSELAELDLKLRGPGDIYGTAQHGSHQLKIASFSDFPLIEKARNAAKDIFPKIEEYPALQQKLKAITSQAISQD